MSPRPWLAALPLLALVLGAAAAEPLPAARSARHALIIGIGEYADPAVPRLRGMRHDVDSAARMAAAMAIPPANITYLRDEAATGDRIRADRVDRLAFAEGRRVVRGIHW